jgi:ribonuclease HI
MSSGYLFCDGGARGNPGPAGAGAVLLDMQQQVLAEGNKYLGEATNNVAEYQGLLIGLDLAQKHKIDTLKIRLDSELIVRQITGQYKVKNPGLRPLWEKVQHALQAFARWEIAHVPRAENAHADKLVNLAIDQRK